MSKMPYTLAAIGLAVLAGCATESKVAPAPAPVVIQPAPQAGTVVVPQNAPAGSAVVVTQAGAGSVVVAPTTPGPLRAGTGRIDSMLDLPTGAAAGSTVPAANKRVGVRMDDGTLQYVDTAAAGLAIGDRVAITSDGYMRHPAP